MEEYAPGADSDPEVEEDDAGAHEPPRAMVPLTKPGASMTRDVRMMSARKIAASRSRMAAGTIGSARGEARFQNPSVKKETKTRKNAASAVVISFRLVGFGGKLPRSSEAR